MTADETIVENQVLLIFYVCFGDYFSRSIQHFIFVMFYTILYHLYNFKNVKNIHGGAFSNTPPWMCFRVFK